MITIWQVLVAGKPVLGQLLLTNRETFLASGEFTPAGIDKAMLEAFQRAADLSPTDLSLAYSRAKAYYAVDPPRWEEALEAWKQLEERPVTTLLEKPRSIPAFSGKGRAYPVVDGRGYDPDRLGGLRSLSEHEQGLRVLPFARRIEELDLLERHGVQGEVAH